MNTPAYDRLVDPRFGLIKRLERYTTPPELPGAYVAYGADVSDARWLGPWQNDPVALGAAFYDHKRARLAAIGEAVERYCGNFVPADLCRSSYQDLAAAGEPALDPAGLILYSDAQYAAPGFPFVPFTSDLRVRWVPGRDLSTGEQVLVPASLVYMNYYTGPHADEPPTNFVIYSGIACGPTRKEAERSALEELIERDATMIWWLSGSPMPGIEVASSPALVAALAAPGDTGAIRYHLIHIRTPFEVPVVGALIEDAALGVVALGVACRADPTAAALKALVESVHLRIFAQGLLDPEGDVWQAVAAGILNPEAYKPFRADRRYLDDYRADFHNVIDLGSQSQLYLDPRMRVHVAPMLNPPERVPLCALPAVTGHDFRAAYLARLRAHGFQPVSVDVTTPDVRSVGLSVVRVIVPGLYPNAPAAFPFLGGRRLYEEPAALGWRPQPLREDELVRAPLPHS